MPRKAAQPDNGEREVQIEWCRGNLAEGSIIYTIARSNNTGAGNHTISCYVAKLDENDVPVIENIDAQVATVLGYKRKEEVDGEGFTVVGIKEMIGVSLVASLSFAVWNDHTKFKHIWL